MKLFSFFSWTISNSGGWNRLQPPGLKGRQKGFTMIEVLLAATLFAIVISSSFGIFRMGNYIWKRSQGRSTIERKALLALENFSKDLRMTIRVTGKENRGKGSGSEVLIPSIISLKTDKDTMQYGLIRYKHLSAQNQLCRTEITASDLYNHTEPECRVIATNIDSFRLRYLMYDGIGETYSWLDDWGEKEEAPIAMEMTMQLDPLLKGEKHPITKIFKRTLLIPAGGMIKDKEEEKETTTETPPPEPEPAPQPT